MFAAAEPSLRPWMEMAVLRHPNLESALVAILAHRMSSDEMPAAVWSRAFEDVLLRPAEERRVGVPECSTPASESDVILHSDDDDIHLAPDSDECCDQSTVKNRASETATRMRKTASMESFAHHAIDAQSKALAWPPVEGNWDLPTLLRADLVAITERDPACLDAAHALFHFKGFLALQSHRIAHVLWQRDRKRLAVVLQSRCSEVFAIDLHPAATIGKGVMFDHGTGIVVGETARIGDGCSLLHGVTLGGTGKKGGRDRHPKLGDCVLVGAGSSILGNIRIGSRSKIGCGSVVLACIPSEATAVGAPAKVVGRAKESNPARESDSALENVDSSCFRPRPRDRSQSFGTLPVKIDAAGGFDDPDAALRARQLGLSVRAAQEAAKRAITKGLEWNPHSRSISELLTFPLSRRAKSGRVLSPDQSGGWADAKITDSAGGAVSPRHDLPLRTEDDDTPVEDVAAEVKDVVTALPDGGYSWRSIWLHLDVDSEGFVGPHQFHERLRARGSELAPSDIDELFFALDSDNDGVVSEAEFMAMSQCLMGGTPQNTPQSARSPAPDSGRSSRVASGDENDSDFQSPSPFMIGNSGVVGNQQRDSLSTSPLSSHKSIQSIHNLFTSTSS